MTRKDRRTLVLLALAAFAIAALRKRRRRTAAVEIGPISDVLWNGEPRLREPPYFSSVDIDGSIF